MRKVRGDIIKVGDLFEKYRTLLRAPEGSVITAFQEVVSDLISIDIPKSKIRYQPRSRTLSLTTGGPQKSEIMLHKKEILTHLRGRLGTEHSPKEIL